MTQWLSNSQDSNQNTATTTTTASSSSIVTLTNADYLTAVQIEEQLDPETTIVMRAQNSGDMYHIRGAMINHPDYNLLIWNVNQETKKQAQQAVEVVEDLVMKENLGIERKRIYYTETDKLSKGNQFLTEKFRRNETWATQDIANSLRTNPFKTLAEFSNHLKDKTDTQSKKLKVQIEQLTPILGKLKADNSPEYATMIRLGHCELAIDFANKYGKYSKEEEAAFQADLEERGHFPPVDILTKEGKGIVIVNFRETGHSDRPGANAPALDTGLVGMEQIIEALQTLPNYKKLIIVPMGEQPLRFKGMPNLLYYWTWPSTKTRRAQLSLLKYLSDRYPVLGAIGMRSGVIDQIAFDGIRVISIDISPHRLNPSSNLPNLKPSKGWTRGLQLEDVYDDAYGRVFLKYPRLRELERGIANWEGAFAQDDLAAIANAISFYFGGSFQGVRHATHPLQPREVQQGLDRLPQPDKVSCYDLCKWVRPYINEMDSFKAQMEEKIKQQIIAYKQLLTQTIDKAQKKAQSVIAAKWQSAGELLSCQWMCDYQILPLLNNLRPAEGYQEMASFVASTLEINRGTEQAAEMYLAYDYLYKLPVAALLLLTHLPEDMIIANQMLG